MQNEIPKLRIEYWKLINIFHSKSNFVRSRLATCFDNKKLFSGFSFFVSTTLSNKIIFNIDLKIIWIIG